MMLRNRSINVSNNKKEDKPSSIPQPVKRHAADAINPKDEPKRKRGGLVELSNAISNSLLIDSGKKSVTKEANKSRPPARRSVSESFDEKPSLAKGSNPEHKRLSVVRELEPKVSDANTSVIVIGDNSMQCEVVDPAPHYDYDKENMGDPFTVSEYATDIFRYYVFREKQFRVGDYMKKHPLLSKEMRAVLADWMVEIQENFELNHETLYLAVKLTDIYLDRAPPVSRDGLQLIASTAIFIASKFDERSPPLIDDFLYVCEDTFNRDMLIDMEMKMLKLIGFDLGSPLSYRYLRRYARVTKTDMSALTLARYVLETSLMFYEFVPVSESLMGAAAFLLAIRMSKIGDWDAILEKYSGYKKEQVEPLMWQLNHMMWMRPKKFDRLLTAYNKYSHPVFFESALVPLLADRFAGSEEVGPPADLAFPSL